MVMGYPPISGMLPVLISEKGQMVATMKSTIGTNVGETKDYLRNLQEMKLKTLKFYQVKTRTQKNMK